MVGAALLAAIVAGLILWNHNRRASAPGVSGGDSTAPTLSDASDVSAAVTEAPAPPVTPPFTRPVEDTRAIVRELSALELPEGTGKFRGVSFTIPSDNIPAFYEAFLASFGEEGYRRFKGAMVWEGPLPRGRTIPTNIHGDAVIGADHGRMVQFSVEGYSYDILFDLDDGDVKLNRYSWDRD